ncbi:hypothetical protein J1N35_018762 [Gossypium stocksii]|uniref:Uncharacterized protein n=1 Tax=Gossypium stocksii TaxID=47602 RepID=A0A9D3VRN1_9ROSI|nr:hypothetical protein J1N35_018762 [Gossypium stocksii]
MFLVGAKFTLGHKCTKSKLYQILHDSTIEGDNEDFQDCNENLVEAHHDPKLVDSHVLSLHAMQGSQGNDTMRLATKFGNRDPMVTSFGTNYLELSTLTMQFQHQGTTCVLQGIALRAIQLW